MNKEIPSCVIFYLSFMLVFTPWHSLLGKSLLGTELILVHDAMDENVIPRWYAKAAVSDLKSELVPLAHPQALDRVDPQGVVNEVKKKLETKLKREREAESYTNEIETLRKRVGELELSLTNERAAREEILTIKEQELTAATKQLQDLVHSAQEDQKKLMNKKNALATEVKGHLTKIQDLELTLQAERKAKKDLQNTENKLRNKFAKVKAYSSQLEGELKGLKDHAKQQSKKVESQHKDLNKSITHTTNLEKKITMLTQNLNKTQKKLEGVNKTRDNAISELNTSMGKHKTEKDELNKQIHAQAQEVVAQKSLFQKTHLELQRLQKELHVTQQALAQEREASKALEDKWSKQLKNKNMSTEEVGKLKAVNESLVSETSRLRNALKEAEDRNVELTTTQLESEKQLVKIKRSEELNHKKVISNLRNESKSHLDTIEKQQSKISSLADELTGINAKAAILQKTNNDMLNKQAQDKKEISGLFAKLKVKDKEYLELKVENEKAQIQSQKVISTHRSKEKQLNDALEAMKAELIGLKKDLDASKQSHRKQEHRKTVNLEKKIKSLEKQIKTNATKNAEVLEVKKDELKQQNEVLDGLRQEYKVLQMQLINAEQKLEKVHDDSSGKKILKLEELLEEALREGEKNKELLHAEMKMSEKLNDDVKVIEARLEQSRFAWNKERKELKNTNHKLKSTLADLEKGSISEIQELHRVSGDMEKRFQEKLQKQDEKIRQISEAKSQSDKALLELKKTMSSQSNADKEHLKQIKKLEKLLDKKDREIIKSHERANASINDSTRPLVKKIEALNMTIADLSNSSKEESEKFKKLLHEASVENDTLSEQFAKERTKNQMQLADAQHKIQKLENQVKDLQVSLKDHSAIAQQSDSSEMEDINAVVPVSLSSASSSASGNLSLRSSENAINVEEGNRILRNGEVQKAEKIFRLSLTKEPGNVEARLGLASCYYAYNELSRSKNDVVDILRDNPDHARSWGLGGLIAWREGSLTTAAKMLDRALHADSEDPQLHNYKAIVLHAQNKDNQAVKQLRTAINLDPYYTEALINLAIMLSTLDTPDLNEAKKYYETALSQGVARDEKLENLLYP